MQRLIVFLKAPRAGLVKTRLANTIGPDAATEAYRRMVSVLLERLGGLSSVELRYAPDDAFAEVTPWLRPGWAGRAQGEGSLGDRLRRAFSDSFNQGACKVAVIGSDCPWVDTSDILAAWKMLDSEDVVLGPARDGGYWLIGLRGDQPMLFEDIAWSTPGVLTQTLARCAGAGLSVGLLRELEDVDTAAEWERFSGR